MKDAYLRPLSIAIIMGSMLYLYSFLNIDMPTLRIMAIICCLLTTGTLLFFIGLTKGERKKICSKIHLISNQ